MSAALLGLLLAAAPADSAQPQAQPRVRTLARLVRLALAQGRDHTLTETGAAALGLNKTPTPLKSLESGPGAAPDGRTRAFSVAYKLVAGRQTPAAVILWRTEQGPSAGPGLSSRNRSFLADLTGRLSCVYENRVGLDGASRAIQKPTPGPDDRHDFREEMAFWLHAAIGKDRDQEEAIQP
jgi:hypothetical protein